MSESKHFRNELERALYGKIGEIDAYLEIADEETIRRDMLVLIESGKSLRDEFAAAALTGFLANASRSTNMQKGNVPHEVAIKSTAKHAYEIADAMLAYRSQSTKEAQ